MSQLRLPKSVLLIFAVLISQAADACPKNLRGLKTQFLQGYDLCHASDWYAREVNQLKRAGYNDPHQIGNLRAPRFINLPDWQKKRTDAADSALRAYEPAPTTWLSWNTAATVIDSNALQNRRHGKMPPLNMEFLKQTQLSSLSGLDTSAGIIRKGLDIGTAMTHAEALTAQQLLGVLSFDLKQIAHPDKKLISFRSTQCLEDRSAEFQKNFKDHRYTTVFKIKDWPVLPADVVRASVERNEIQCGYLVYAPPQEVEPQLEKWFEFVNQTTAGWNSGQMQMDPILAISRIQRWFIAIHPFTHGNGRTSRLVMDWLFESLGLPAPILRDQNFDMYSTEDEWAHEVGNGLLRALESAEQCLKDSKSIGCAEISYEAERGQK